MGVSQCSTRPAQDVQDGAAMLDSSSRLPCVAPLRSPNDWEESTFTRPMRSPFAPEPQKPAAEVEVKLEEAALFEAPEPRKLPTAKPHAALRRVTTAPPPRRSLPVEPPMDAEATSKGKVNPELIRAIRERDSHRMRQAIRAVEALDLAKTVEQPAVQGCDDLHQTSAIRRSR